MARYINADALEKYLWEESESDDWFGVPEVSITYKDISIYVAKMPAADVRENVHAHIVEEQGYLYCSNCHTLLPQAYRIYRLNFCGNCGAIMDEVVE